jgi:hypothetical protein
MNELAPDNDNPAGEVNSSTLVISRSKIMEQLYDVKNIASFLTVICVLGGFVWNLGYFYVIDYDYMKILTFGDYITAITSQVPFIVFAIVFVGLYGVLANKVLRSGFFGRWSLNIDPSRKTPFILSMIMVGVIQLLGFLAADDNKPSGFDFFSVPVITAYVGSMAVYFLTLWILVGYGTEVYRNTLAIYAALTVALLVLIAFSGADSAKRALSGGSMTEVHPKKSEDKQSDQKQSDLPKLVLLRAVSNGVFALDPEGHRIVFLQSSEIGYLSSPVQDKQGFSLTNLHRVFMP